LFGGAEGGGAPVNVCGAAVGEERDRSGCEEEGMERDMILWADKSVFSRATRSYQLPKILHDSFTGLRNLPPETLPEKARLQKRFSPRKELASGGSLAERGLGENRSITLGGAS
jgi:hypothetical protein